MPMLLAKAREVDALLAAQDAEIARLREALNHAYLAIDEMRMPQAKKQARAALGETEA